MIDSIPAWLYRTPRSRIGYRANAFLTRTKAVGLWFCLDRNLGQVVWQREPREMRRANAIIAIEHDIIVASEYRDADGPYSAYYGTYRISLHDGLVLRKASRPPAQEHIRKLKDFFTPLLLEFHDAPLLVQAGRIITETGHVLDVATGLETGITPITEEMRYSRFSREERLLLLREIDCGTLGLLRTGKPDQPEPGAVMFRSGPLQLYMADQSGEVRWSFDAASGPDIADPENLPFKVAEPFVYLLVSDQKQYYADMTKERLVFPPCLYALWTIDMRSGEIIQREPISSTNGMQQHCSFQQCDDEGLLISWECGDDYVLAHYHRRGHR